MPVAVRIFHPGAPPTRSALATWLHAAKTGLAERHARRFQRVGAEDVRVVVDPSGRRSFGARLRTLAGELAGFDGLVILGSGALALATTADLRRFVAAARQPGRALANNCFSADIVAIGGLNVLGSLPNLRTDNALPRWLAEVAAYRVADLRASWRLGVDLDSPLDVILTGLDRRHGTAPPRGIDPAPQRARLAGLRQVAADPGAELLVAGRTSAGTLSWLERRAGCRVRALVEERGLRASVDAALVRDRPRPSNPAGRPPASVLGALLERDGPEALGPILARLADGAVVDSRVLLAHRYGRDESAWPPAADRFASDLLLPDQVGDPWLRALTASAAAAPIPVVLGGHTLVGPGLRLALGRRSASRAAGPPARATRMATRVSAAPDPSVGAPAAGD
jgi:hypothetical protein